MCCPNCGAAGDSILAAVKTVAGWHERAPGNQCRIACQQLVDLLAEQRITPELQHLYMTGPTRPATLLEPFCGEHHLLRIGYQVADPTWGQIDTGAHEPWKLYCSVSDLADDWTRAYDLADDTPLAIGPHREDRD